MLNLDLLAYDTFQQLLAERGIRPATFDTNLKAMEAVELMATVCVLGDQVLLIARAGQVPSQVLGKLASDLITCFVDPLDSGERIIKIERELRKYHR